MKVAINALSDDKVRSVERSNIGPAIRDFAQVAGQRDFKAFGFDEALDLVRKVSGYVGDDDFADLGQRREPYAFSPHEVAAPELAVDGQIEHRRSRLRLFSCRRADRFL